VTGKTNIATAITCVDLTKIYETGAVALDELTLAIERGMSFGLLGENGAGKSTLVRLVMGFLFPTRGTLNVLGETEVQRTHSRVGYLHERPHVELRFTGRRYLTYMAELSGFWDTMMRERVAAVLEQVDLSQAADKRMATYSKGMLQRLSIAQALLTDPELLVLVLVCFATLFFPFRVYVAGFYGTSNLALGAIAILGTAIMVRQATSARTYLVLSRLSSRASYSRGLMLATALLRVPLLGLMLLLVLSTGQLIDPAAGPLLIGVIGLLPNCLVLAVLTVVLSSPMATRLKRIIFLAWLALVLFAQSPVFWLPEVVMSVLRFASLPLLPLIACYNISVAGTLGLAGALGVVIEGVYVVALALIAGHWLERRELLLY
jgi:ABC-type transport system involved in cytochrome c biogenesis ATPase subunit